MGWGQGDGDDRADMADARRWAIQVDGVNTRRETAGWRQVEGSVGHETIGWRLEETMGPDMRFMGWMRDNGWMGGPRTMEARR